MCTLLSFTIGKMFKINVNTSSMYEIQSITCVSTFISLYVCPNTVYLELMDTVMRGRALI